MHLSLSLLAASIAACLFAVPVSAEDPAASTRAALEPFVARGEAAGAVVLITDRDKVLERYAIGFADIASGRAMREDDLFWLASTYKPFVGTAMMMLVEEGRVDLDAPVATYLPGFAPPLGTDAPGGAMRPPARPVTVRMLLTHTGGINPDVPPIREGRPPRPNIAELAAAYSQGPLLFEAGTRFNYSDASIFIASRIIEVVSGMTLDRFLRTRLLDPLGMTETYFCLGPAQRPRRPTNYYLPENAAALAPAPTDFFAYSLGDECEDARAVPTMFSTADDLARFAQMVLRGGEFDGRRYLSPESVAEMTRNQLSDEVQKTVPGSGPPDYVSYGLGWGVSLNGSYFHPGVGMTDIIVDPTHRIATILLMQSSAPASFPARAALIAASEASHAPRSP